MAVKFLNGIDVDGSMNIAASDVPNLDASKITSGTFSADRIPTGLYQPAGDYLDLETANTTFQPLGNYLTSVPSEYLTQTEGDARYLKLSGGSITGDVTITSGDHALWTIDNGTGTSWRGRIGHKNSSADTSSFLGSYNSRAGVFAHNYALNAWDDLYVNTVDGTNGGNVRLPSMTYVAGNLVATQSWVSSQGYLTSLPSHNHDTLYDAIGSADAVGQQVNERIDTEVFDAINSKQAAGNYFTDGDTVLNMANNDGLVFNDTNNLMYVKADGIDYPIIDSRGGTVTGSINMTGGGTKLSMNNGDIVGVNQLKINDPGEGIVWNNGSSGDITLAVVDDASDNRLNLAGTNASLSINNATVATQSWVSGQGYLTSIPSTYATDAEVNTAVGAVDARIDNEVFPAINDLGNAIPTNNNQLTNGAGYITSADGGNAATLEGRRANDFLKANDGELSNTDLDTLYDDDSTLYFSNNSYSTNSNIPYNNYFTLLTLRNPYGDNTGDGANSLDRGSQLWFGDTPGRFYVRYFQGTSTGWHPWEQVWTSHSLTSVSQLTNDSLYATESYVNTAVANLVDTAPAALNTLNELAAALGDDANFSTTVANNIGAIDTRINDEVMPYIASVETIANGKLDATAKAADSNLLDGINSTSFLRSDQADTMSGTLTITGSNGVSRLRIEGTTPTIDLDDADGDSFYIHVNSNNFYVLTDRDGGGDYGTWETPHPMSLEADTNSAYFFGNKLNSAAYQPSSAFDSAGSADAVATALNQRIDTEVFDAIATVDANIPTNNNQLTNGAGYLTSVPSALSVTSLAVGSGVTLTESTDRADLLMIKSSTSTWGGLQISNTSNEIIFSLMGDGTTGGIYDDQNSDWLIQWTENAGVRLYHNAGEKLTTTSTGITVTGQVNATGGNSGNWNTAYGWGNHASAGYLTSIPSDYVRQGQDIVSGNIHPVGDRQQLLGLDSNRWQIVFCEILDSAGQHEKNLQNPVGEKSVADYPTGTVMVWENGKNVPCTTYANHMRMGIAVENVDSPMIQGAEPVLVTGTVAEGDYLVTSTTEGHAVAVSRDTVKEEQLWDCVIGKALEGGEGESHLIKTWVTI